MAWIFSSKAKLTKKKNSDKKVVAKTLTNRNTNKDYRAVKVVCEAGEACEDALNIKDRVFLCLEAPWLPLKDCARPLVCQCHYTHLDDRRVNLRRDSDHGLPQRGIERERRLSGDRRRTETT